MKRYDVAVVGAGVMGSAAARAIARRGRSVVLFEQFELGHKRGSSHGTSRIFRISYPDRSFAAMAQEALALWHELEDEVGERLLTTTGGLDAGDSLDAHIDALDSIGAPYELLQGRTAARRWPLALDAMPTVLHQPDGGFVAAERAISAFLGSAEAAGAEVLEATRVLELDASADGVTLRTSGGDMTVDIAVVTAGSWARPLLAGAEIDLPVTMTQQTIAYFAIDEVLPPLVEWVEPVLYALPAGSAGLKAGLHAPGRVVDPDHQGSPDEDAVEQLSEWVAARYPTATPRPHHVETCMYTNTVDESFVLERHDRIVVGSPCSGHGFKFAPLIGRLLADLASE